MNKKTDGPRERRGAAPSPKLSRSDSMASFDAERRGLEPAARIKSSLFSFVQALGFVLACALAACATVAPLWLLASRTPRLYSALTIAAAAAFVIYKLVFWTKKRGFKRLLLLLARAACAAGAAGGFFFFLSRFARAPALLCAALGVAAFFALGGLSRKIDEKK